MQPTRYRIMEIMKEQGGVTVADLARQLDMAPVSVRHHLDVLQGENLIWTPRVRRRGTVGRPQQIYALTEAANAHFPSNLESVALIVLTELKDILQSDQLQEAFDRVADRMAREAGFPDQNSGLEERLEHAVDFLNDKGYLARLEREGDGFVLYTLNCPYSGVAGEHPELCAMDKRLITQLAGSSPVPLTRISEGSCRCAYRVAGSGPGCQTEER